jgi:hypothetical protein
MDYLFQVGMKNSGYNVVCAISRRQLCKAAWFDTPGKSGGVWTEHFACIVHQPVL